MWNQGAAERTGFYLCLREVAISVCMKLLFIVGFIVLRLMVSIHAR